MEDLTRERRGLEWLIANRNDDGAWGYRAGRASYVEPTALAVVALLPSKDLPGAVGALSRALDWLGERQRQDGSWGVSEADDEASWMTAYAVWALALARDALGRADLAPQIASGVDALLVERRISLTSAEDELQRQVLRADPTLVGWSWTPETASWIFPTA